MSDARAGRLLEIARASLEEALGLRPGPPPAPPREPWLLEPAATFVTLSRDGALRGCIGTVLAYRPLVEDLRANALAAALADPRFPPLSAAELPGLHLGVSLLSHLEPIGADTEGDLLASLRPGVDGLWLVHGFRRATFLPQVWTTLPSPAQFLLHLKRKAGIEDGFWSPEVEVRRYTVATWTTSW